MTDEEMRRTMHFILDQQAQFTADMQQMREVQGQQQQQIGKLAEAILAITSIVGRLGDAQERTERIVARLAEAQERSERKIAGLADAQTRTDDRLNAFIGFVERYISEHRNGKE